MSGKVREFDEFQPTTLVNSSMWLPYLTTTINTITTSTPCKIGQKILPEMVGCILAHRLWLAARFYEVPNY